MVIYDEAEADAAELWDIGSWRTWYETTANVGTRSRISFSQVQRCPFDLANVERLRIEGVLNSTNFNWNEFLAKFPRLCHLEINRFNGYGRCIDLNLPATLGTIRFGVVNVKKLHLNAPQLHNLYCGFGFRNIEFLHPESVKHLRIKFLGDTDNDDLQVFPNVEWFRCAPSFYTLAGPGLDLIRLFPKAREMHFENLVTYNFAKLARVIGDVVAGKNRSGRTELNIFYGGSEMVDRNSFRRYVDRQRSTDF